MKGNRYILGAAIVGSVLFSSCADKLDITPPNGITDEQITKLMQEGDEAKITMIMNAIVAPAVQYFNGSTTVSSSDGRYATQQGLDHMRCLEGNDMVFGDNANGLFGMAEYQFNNFTGAEVDKNTPYWFGSAIVLNNANKLLGYMTKEMADINTNYKDGRARGLALRAYAYMSLMENYQDAYLQGGKDKLGMSLYDTYNPLQETKARSTSTETYDFIKSDLNEAISLLTAAGIGYTSSQEDIDMGLLKFLLARVSLWTGDYATCISACNDIINSGNYSFIKEENYGGQNTGSSWSGNNVEILPQTNAFTALHVNPECILGYSRTNSYNKVVFGSWLNIFGTSYGGSSRGYARIDDRLYNKIDDNDFRKECFRTEEIGDYYYASNKVTARIPDYVNVKFAATKGLADDGISATDESKVGNMEFCKYRLSEVYLMLAEAKLANGDEAGAKSTLNQLLAARTKAGSTPLTCDNYSSMAGLTTLQKIQLQSRIELWGEGGREFYNNKRWNIPVDRNGSTSHVYITTYPVSGMTLQIPQRELIDNSLSVQN